MKKIFIGIDFSKEKFDATLIKAEGLKECAPSMHEVFDNKTSGFRRLVRWVKATICAWSVPTRSNTLQVFCGQRMTKQTPWLLQNMLCVTMTRLDFTSLRVAR